MRKHITEEQRYTIATMLQIPMTQKTIAAAIGLDESTISREIKRNSDGRSGNYV
ncbi:MAG: helix-turn-helix domain-containing protein, partial [Microbacter sp.]